MKTDNILYLILGFCAYGIICLTLHCGKDNYNSSQINNEPLKKEAGKIEAKKTDLKKAEVKAKDEFRTKPIAEKIKVIEKHDIKFVADTVYLDRVYTDTGTIARIGTLLIDSQYTHEQLSLSDSIITIQKLVITNDSSNIVVLKSDNSKLKWQRNGLVVIGGLLLALSLIR